MLQREQVERMRAATAAGKAARAAHHELAERYRARIDAHRQAAQPRAER